MDLQFWNFPSTPLSITLILFLRFGFGRAGVPEGGSEEPDLGWLGSVGDKHYICRVKTDSQEDLKNL